MAGTQERVDASGFEPFEASVGEGAASHTSAIEAELITASLANAASASPSSGPGDPDDHLVVDARHSVTFSLDEPTLFELSAQLAQLDYVVAPDLIGTGFDHYAIEMSAVFAGPEGDVAGGTFDLYDFDCEYPFCTFDEHIDESGVLPPGTYTLDARAFAELDPGWVCVGFGCTSQVPVTTQSQAAVNVERSSVDPQAISPNPKRVMRLHQMTD